MVIIIIIIMSWIITNYAIFYVFKILYIQLIVIINKIYNLISRITTSKR
nr:MAG TPA: hypothetical protein [Caudoviricetes sp.]